MNMFFFSPEFSTDEFQETDSNTENVTKAAAESITGGSKTKSDMNIFLLLLK